MSRLALSQLLRIPWILVIVICFAPPATSAEKLVAAICESAAIVASRDSGVPLSVLRAISLTETGRRNDGRLRPWPWTVNMEGKGKWFEDQMSARAFVEKHFRRGARSFDVGCFQVNYKWHGHAFRSIDDMFDPITNARYAASFLGELYAEFGDWSAAAGAYHSRTPKYAKTYKARFNRIHAELDDLEAISIPETHVVADTQEPLGRPKSQNRYPFFAGPVLPTQGSLVPRDVPAIALIDPSARRPLLDAQ